MSNFKERVEALNCKAASPMPSPGSYIVGTVDMRNAAKDIAAEADATVARLEAEVERYRNGNTVLIEALMGMAWQYMGDKDGKCRHMFMSAGEECCDALEAAGVATPTGDGCQLDWAALEARKPKRKEWAQAVAELDASPEEKARLLSLAARSQEGA